LFYVLFRQNVLKDAQCCTLRAGRPYSEFPGPFDLPADFKGICMTLETRYPSIMLACALLPFTGPTGDGNESHQHCGACHHSPYGIVPRRFCNGIGRTRSGDGRGYLYGIIRIAITDKKRRVVIGGTATDTPRILLNPTSLNFSGVAEVHRRWPNRLRCRILPADIEVDDDRDGRVACPSYLERHDGHRER